MSGTFQVPQINCNTYYGQSAVAIWVGIDGYGSSDVQQIGVWAECQGWTPSYWTWYEMYPQAAISVNSTVPVYAGNVVTASVVYSNGVFKMTINNLSNGHSQEYDYSNYGEPLLSTECIVEDPAVGFASIQNSQPLANFGTVTFQSCNMQASQSISIVQVSILNGNNQVLAAVIGGNPNNFTVQWRQSQ